MRVKQLKIEPTVIRADYGQLPDLGQVDWSNDVLFTWNGTTSGVRVPNGDWIADDREGLSFADATSGVFAYDIPWDKIDVATFSWQKVLGGEGAHGVLILGPRAVERLQTYTPAWPLPKVFRLMSKGALAEGIFKGETINTPSMLCGRGCDLRAGMGEGPGRPQGPDRAFRCQCGGARPNRRRARVARPSRRRSGDPVEDRVCLTVKGADVDFIKKLRGPAREGRRGLDIAGYRDAPPGLRIWCGATVETADIEALGPWLDWAWSHTAAGITFTAPERSRWAAFPVSHEQTTAGLRRAPPRREFPMADTEEMPKVLIGDKMDPKAAAIFRERGIEVDEKHRARRRTS